jgi:hypothetical protein
VATIMNFSSLWRKPKSEARAAPRHGLSLVTTIRGEGGKRGSILIRDFSENGFRAECLVRFKRGSAVVVDLPGGVALEATVEWTRRNRIGVSFLKPAALNFLLTAAE